MSEERFPLLNRVLYQMEKRLEWLEHYLKDGVQNRDHIIGTDGAFNELCLLFSLAQFSPRELIPLIIRIGRMRRAYADLLTRHPTRIDMVMSELTRQLAELEDTVASEGRVNAKALWLLIEILISGGVPWPETAQQLGLNHEKCQDVLQRFQIEVDESTTLPEAFLTTANLIDSLPEQEMGLEMILAKLKEAPELQNLLKAIARGEIQRSDVRLPIPPL